MPADITITTMQNHFGGRNGLDSASRKDAAAAAAAGDGVGVRDEGGRQGIAATEQALPPGKADERKEDGRERLEKAVSDINAYVQNLQRDLEFRVDRDLGRTIITVLDSETREVIRQIPSEEVLKGARLLKERAGADAPFGGLLLQVNI